MKQVKGWHCPDYDTDIAANLSDTPEYAGRATYQFEWWRQTMLHANNFRHAVDIGGHIGLWSHYFVNAYRHVTAFEPVPEHAQCFRANVPDAILHEVAIGETSGDVGMVLKPPVSLKARVYTIEKGTVFKVPIRTLDSFALRDVDLIKIDCEGYELFVLRGGEQTIRREKPLMVVEQKPGNVSRYGQAAEYRQETEAVDLLKSWGAKVLHDMGGDWFLGWE